MLMRLLRLIVALLLIITIPIGIVLSAIIWIFTDFFFLDRWAEWVINGE